MDGHDTDSAALAGIGPEDLEELLSQVLRVKVRMDYYPRLGELDTAIVARSFPGGAVVRNNVFSWYDRYHVGIAAHDLVSQLYDTLKVFPEPF